MFKNRLELVKNLMQINAYYLNFYVQVPLAYISSLVLTFYTFCMSGFFVTFWFFFKVNSGVFLHNRVATLVPYAGRDNTHWRAVFPNEKRERLAGCTEDRRAGRRAAQKVRRAAEKGGMGCRKRQPSGPPFYAAQLTVQPPARLNVQPTGLSCSTACRPTFLCSSPARGKFMHFI